MKVYLASPFFTAEQLEVVMQVEKALAVSGLEYYSPRKDGVLQDMSLDERKAAMKKIFELNVKNIDECDLLLAIMNWKDLGVVFELGLAFANAKTIITFCSNDEKVNVMLKECSDGHVKGFQQLTSVLHDYVQGRPIFVDQDGRDVY